MVVFFLALAGTGCPDPTLHTADTYCPPCDPGFDCVRYEDRRNDKLVQRCMEHVSFPGLTFIGDPSNNFSETTVEMLTSCGDPVPGIDTATFGDDHTFQWGSGSQPGGKWTLTDTQSSIYSDVGDLIYQGDVPTDCLTAANIPQSLSGKLRPLSGGVPAACEFDPVIEGVLSPIVMTSKNPNYPGTITVSGSFQCPNLVTVQTDAGPVVEPGSVADADSGTDATSGMGTDAVAPPADAACDLTGKPCTMNSDCTICGSFSCYGLASGQGTCQPI
jgi:hypothetical protein